MNPSKYVKAIYGAVTALAAAFGVAMQDGTVTGLEWATIAVATVVGFVTVWGATNAPEKPAASARHEGN